MEIIIEQMFDDENDAETKMTNIYSDENQVYLHGDTKSIMMELMTKKSYLQS